MEMPKVIFSIEPGNGTWDSILDALERNKRGLCAKLNCGKLLGVNANSYFLLQKLCPDCQKTHKEILETKPDKPNGRRL